jgi:hypothetical protein
MAEGRVRLSGKRIIRFWSEEVWVENVMKEVVVE